MSALHSQPISSAESSATTQVSEFIFPGDPRQQLPLILPVLSHLSRCGDSRWLTCIGTSFLSKKDCVDYGLDWRRLLQVLPSARCDVFEIACRALAAGKSHTAVCLAPAAVSQQQIQQLEQAARLGSGRCILIRCR